MQSSQNPRNLREKYQSWIGKRVTVGLTTFHYLCGTWKAIDGYDAVFTIGSVEKRIRLDEVDNVAEAPGAQAEYFK
ncbi:MAG TPA: hypothetical protein VFF06_34325 [Polyangia bacterium]|nr:hypothetical protein [Polyangia bacterium]